MTAAGGLDAVRRLALQLPGVEEGTSYGTPAFRVRGRFLARLREDGETLAVKIDLDEREVLMRAEPGKFFLTDHYRNYAAILVRPTAVSEAELQDVLESAWRRLAPKKLVEEYDGHRRTEEEQ